MYARWIEFVNEMGNLGSC